MAYCNTVWEGRREELLNTALSTMDVMGCPSRYMGFLMIKVVVLGTAIKKNNLHAAACIISHHSQTHCQNMLITNYKLKRGKHCGKRGDATPHSVHNELRCKVC